MALMRPVANGDVRCLKSVATWRGQSSVIASVYSLKIQANNCNIYEMNAETKFHT